MPPFNPEEDEIAPLVPDVRQEPPPGGTSRFTAEGLRLEGQAAKSRDNAMDLLGRALANQPEITPSQGFAAALLAAVPTIGGYLAGKAVGRPNIPEGTYFKGVSPGEFSKMFGSSGANAGGAMGAQIGQNAAQGYFNSREEETKQQIPVLAKQAAIEENRAQDLSGQANRMNLAGLEADEWKERLPLQAQKEIQVAEATQEAAARRAKEQYDYERANPRLNTRPPNRFELMSPEQQKAYAEKMSGRDEFGNPTKKQVHISDAVTEKVAAIGNLVDEARLAANEMKGFKSWGELRAASSAAGLDPEAKVARVRALVAAKIKEQSGTAASEAEAKRITGFIMGDESLGPDGVANYLERFAQREAARGHKLITTAETINDPEARKNLFAEPSAGNNTGGSSPLTYEEILAEERSKLRKERGL